MATKDFSDSPSHIFSVTVPDLLILLIVLNLSGVRISNLGFVSYRRVQVNWLCHFIKMIF